MSALDFCWRFTELLTLRNSFRFADDAAGIAARANRTQTQDQPLAATAAASALLALSAVNVQEDSQVSKFGIEMVEKRPY